MPRSLKDATLADWGELRFLAWLRRAITGGETGAGRGVPISIGDDAAVLRLARGRDAVVTTDALIEGVHFRHDWISPSRLGAKALIASLSDIAAMGARPVAAFMSLGVPPTAPIAALKQFVGGVRREGRKWNCPLAGGDLVRSPQWTISVTIIGEPLAKGRAIRRSAARPGQGLYLTGVAGESGAGLDVLRRGGKAPALIARHVRPTPRLREAEVLVRLARDLAMIDVSDGVMNEVGHLARESSVAIEIDPAALPISRALKSYADSIGRNPLDWALAGGEDYELLFTTKVPAGKIEAALRRAGLKTRVTQIGRVAKGKGVELAGSGADRRAASFEHFA